MAAHFAPVAPLAIHRQLAEAAPDAFGRYHLLLAPDILADPVGYANFWGHFPGPKSIIVDNGVIEEGRSRPLDDLAAAAQLVGATVVVLPDVIGDQAATLRAAERALPLLRRMLPPEVGLLGVGQGRTATEYMECLLQLEFLGADWLALPKGLQERGVGRRDAFMRGVMSGLPLHLLGFSDDFVDDLLAARRPYGPLGGQDPITGERLHIWPSPFGIDSAAPVWLGAQGVGFDELPRSYPGRRPRDYQRWGELDRFQLNTVIHNIRRVHQWLEAP